MINNYINKKDKCVSHSLSRLKQRYKNNVDDNTDYKEIRQILLDCVKSQTNIVYSKSQGKFKTEYIILHSTYFRFIYAKDVDEIMSFLPIQKDEKKIIKQFEERAYKKLYNNKKENYDKNTQTNFSRKT